VGVDHSRLDILMTKQLLNSANVIAVLQKISGEGMTEDVKSYALIYVSKAGSHLDRFL
jgi:hypothetical protein